MKKFWWKIKVACRVLFNNNIFVSQGGTTYTDMSSWNPGWGFWEFKQNGKKIDVYAHIDANRPDNYDWTNFILGTYDKTDGANIATILEDGLTTYNNELKEEYLQTLISKGWQCVNPDVECVILKEEYQSLLDTKEEYQKLLDKLNGDPDDYEEWEAHNS